MFSRVRTVISWLFRWGEHAAFAADIAKFFGVQKMVFSIEAGLLTSLAQWPDQPRPFWNVMAGLAGFAVTLVIINVIWGLFNKWKISKAMTSSPSATGIDDLLSVWPLPLRVQAEKDKSDKESLQ
jgi:hypothetical protein